MNKILSFNNFLSENEEKLKNADVTDGQYIACYALSSNIPADYVDNDKEEFTGDKKEQWFSELGLSDKDMNQWYQHLGMNKVTMDRMLKKYRLLLRGEREGRHNEAVFPRIITWFDKLQKMEKSEIVELANKALDEAPVVKDAHADKIKKAKAELASKAQVANDFAKAVIHNFKGDREKAAKFFGPKYNKTPKEFLAWIK